MKVIRPNCTLRESALKLISHQIGALVVTDESGQLVGIISERDLIRAITEYDAGLIDKHVSDVMTRSVITRGPHDSIFEVLSTMKANAIRHIPILDDSELVGIVSIRELTRAYEMLQVQANTDALTGLSNRRNFLEMLANEFDRSGRYGHSLFVAMIDIDHFKRVNDTFGHEAGDGVLRAFAKLLVGELRTVDRVGRLGGEEFAAFFPETDFAGAKLACDRLLAMIRGAEIEVDEARISFTVSIGLAKANPTAENAAAVLKRADKLLYAAKTEGRNRIAVEAADGPHPTDEVQQLQTNLKAMSATGP